MMGLSWSLVCGFVARMRHSVWTADVDGIAFQPKIIPPYIQYLLDVHIQSVFRVCECVHYPQTTQGCHQLKINPRSTLSCNGLEIIFLICFLVMYDRKVGWSMRFCSSVVELRGACTRGRDGEYLKTRLQYAVDGNCN